MKAIKGTSRRAWLGPTEMQSLRALSDSTKLGQTELLSQIISAGLASLALNGNTFKLPLTFRVHED